MRFPVLLLLAVWVIVLSSPCLAEDDPGWVKLPFTPFQLAIVPGYGQVFTESTPVYGLRVSALFGIQSDVVGLDVGSGMQTDTLTGLAIGGCSVAEKDATGVQFGLACNYVEEDTMGLQIGVVNMIRGALKGLQFGVANSTEGGTAVQIGGLNTATSV
jgi:hypothetical protein